MTTKTKHETGIGWTHRPDPETGVMTVGSTWNAPFPSAVVIFGEGSALT